MEELHARLRRLPAVSALLEREDVGRWLGDRPRAEVVLALRRALETVRAEVAAGGTSVAPEEVVRRARGELERAAQAGLRRVVNATGIVLHTGLGRAVLPPQALEALVREGSAYCLLAMDAETADRGRRERFCEEILRELTGCEAATVVNNNAAAVLLALNTLAAGREAIVSRGQLVEIGGAFRLPEVMARAGCRMVEVGCTNRTHLADYRAAITEATGALVRVHPSNYRVQGFTAEVGIEELCALGRERGIPVIDDLGSGALVPLRPEFDEPLVRDSLAAGATLVTCSADKLIGGPQGGLLLGERAAIAACDDNQLARALRVGKLDLIALEATLRLFRDRATLVRDHPTTRMLLEEVADIEPRARRLAAAIRRRHRELEPRVEPGSSFAGSGALPIREIPTRVVALRPPDGMGAAEAARRLRTGDPSVFVRIREDRLLLDPRTLQPGEDRLVLRALAALAEPPADGGSRRPA